jgi:hypothetical protein
VRQYIPGEPYTANRLQALTNRLERLAARNDMLALLEEGGQAFIGFQSSLAALLADIQRDISLLKKGIRKTKQAHPALSRLRTLRWYARCLGDALAWQVLLFDRKTIAALNSGKKSPISQSDHSDTAVMAVAAHLLGNRYGVPIVHDITNWLRAGDVTFLRWVDDQSPEWFFRTIEMKSSLSDLVTNDDGSTNATMLVDLYSNEPLDLPEERDRQLMNAAESMEQKLEPPQRRLRADRRIEGQFDRLDKMVRRRDLAEDTITTFDGVPNVILRVDHSPAHHWTELRRAIRQARHDGYSFFDIDGFIGYALVYNGTGVTEDDLRQPQMLVDVKRRLLMTNAGPQHSLIVRQLPLLEKNDTPGAPIMRFFSYAIPKRAKADLIHNRLVIVAVVNMGPLDAAVARRGLSVASQNGDLAMRGYPYAADLVWPNGETDSVAIPMISVSKHVETAIHEFCGLDFVADHVASVTSLPGVIRREEWLAALKSPGQRSNQALEASDALAYEGVRAVQQ